MCSQENTCRFTSVSSRRAGISVPHGDQRSTWRYTSGVETSKYSGPGGLANGISTCLSPELGSGLVIRGRPEVRGGAVVQDSPLPVWKK